MKKLPMLLEAIWLELTENEQKDYAVSRKKITEKLLPIGFIPLDEFHKCKLQSGELLSLFVYELKRLLLQAMPDIDTNACDQLLLHQFLIGLPLAVSKQLRASDDAKSLDKAVERARLLMAIKRDEMQAAASLVPRPLPDFISQPWRKIGGRPGTNTTSRTGNGGLG